MASELEIERFLRTVNNEDRITLLMYLLQDLQWGDVRVMSLEELEALRVAVTLTRLELVVLYRVPGTSVYRTLFIRGPDSYRYFGGAYLLPGTHRLGHETNDMIIERIMQTQLAGLGILEPPVEIGRTNLLCTPRGHEVSQLYVAVASEERSTDGVDGAWLPVKDLPSGLPAHCRLLVAQAMLWLSGRS